MSIATRELDAMIEESERLQAEVARLTAANKTLTNSLETISRDRQRLMTEMAKTKRLLRAVVDLCKDAIE